MQDEISIAPGEYMEDTVGAHASPIDIFGILAAVLRRWKLIVTTTLLALIATFGVLQVVPAGYKSTVEILVYDPQQQINAAVQKPIFPFVDAVGNDAMRTEINVLTSKSMALRVASELGLDKDPEFQPHNPLVRLAQRLGFPGVARVLSTTNQAVGGMEDEQAERLDLAADALLEHLQVWEDAYTLFITATSQNPVMARRLASTIAKDYLATQREARQEALQRVANWLKGRVDSLQSSVLETEASITKLKAENNIRDSEFNKFQEQQIGELNTEIMKARADADGKRARLDQVRSVIGTNGDVQGIPELTASATLSVLRQRQAELTYRASELQKKLGDGHLQVVAIRAELATISQQISAEAEHILGNMKNSLRYRRAAATGTRDKPEEPHRTHQFGNLRQAAAVAERRRGGPQALRELSLAVQRYHRAADAAGCQRPADFTGHLSQVAEYPTSQAVLCGWRNARSRRRSSVRLPVGMRLPAGRQERHGNRAVLRPACRGDHSLGARPQHPWTVL